MSGGTDLATAAQLFDLTEPAALVQALADHAARHPGLPLVIGTGWQPGHFGDHNLTAALLDTACASRPVIAYDSSFHNACLNTTALELAGIGPDTPDPPNGHIVKVDGRPTGMLHEEAIPWALARLPDLTEDDRMAGLRAGQGHALAHGITGILDPRITELEARIYGRAQAEGALTLWVAGAALVTEADTPETALWPGCPPCARRIRGRISTCIRPSSSWTGCLKTAPPPAGPLCRRARRQCALHVRRRADPGAVHRAGCRALCHPCPCDRRCRLRQGTGRAGRCPRGQRHLARRASAGASAAGGSRRLAPPCRHRRHGEYPAALGAVRAALSPIPRST
ncbi:MAG: amidohydrolase family protein [Gemmobacter sp.]|nr:amidohydrolase family protein [Gemmobacter sp.]